MGMLHKLELENFKSYKGKHTIGPFSKFTAIIGPNGSGKSNMMDAISFVLGEKTQSLRVKKLGDLIHGAPIGKPVAKGCSVSMEYHHDDGRKTLFTRAISSGASEFRLDGKVVTVQQYNQEMESINIFIKAKNFLVYQGAIESIAMKNPKERTALFEELSRSCEFQVDYERLKNEMTKAEDDTQQNMNKRRGIAQEKREAKMEKDEAEKYQQMKEEAASKQRIFYLHQIYHCERIMNEAKEQLAEQRKSIGNLEHNKSEEDQKVAKAQADLKKAQKEYHKLDRKINDKQKEMNIQRPKYVQIQAEVEHHKNKLETAKKVLTSAQALEEKNKQQTEVLEKQRREIEQKKADFEDEIATQTQQQELNLDDEQINEYHTLKRKALMESGRTEIELNAAQQILDTEKSNLAHEQRRQREHEGRAKNKEQDVERAKKQIEMLHAKIKENEETLEEKTKALKDTETQVIETKARAEKINRELNEVLRKLSEASGDTAEGERNQKRNEAIDNLRRVFPDRIYGRLVDLCQPSHKRFQLAITKVLQKHMMSIVCDTEETAKDAINYLKQQRLQPETFLPSDTLDVLPINEKLRDIKRPSGVKLVFDVINLNNQAARKALQYACGNSLVCEHQEDAKQLAYGGSGMPDRYKAVSMDGTLFQASGVMSGGSADLKQKAKKWDDKVVRGLRETRNKLQEDQNNLQKNRRKELEVEMQRSELTSINQRLATLRRDVKKMESETLERLQNELEAHRAEAEMIPPRIQDIEEKVKRDQETVQKLIEKNNAVADKVFHDFCLKIGIRNIREYEDRELKIHQEAQDRLREFENELDKLKNEIEYLRSEDRSKRVNAEREKAALLERELKDLRKKQKAEAAAINELETSLENEKVNHMERKEIVQKLELELTEVKKAAQVAAREVTAAEKAFLGLENLVARKQMERHSLLHTAKMNQIKLPLSSGSLAEVEAGDYDDDDDEVMDEPSTSAESQSLSQEQIQRESNIKLNYTSLPREYKEVEDEDNVKKLTDRLNKEISESQAHISRLNAPNMKANQRMEEVKEREAESTEELEAARRKAKKIRQQFEKIKTERYRRFQECFEPVSAKIDEIYKSLSRNQSAQAFLGAENMEEPYLEGIQYNCVAPGKRFRPMDNLSGGEKTVAALALLFAVHARNPSPFFVLDEIDAALDNTNIGKVASFICESAREEMQIIVISLKEEFYNKADSLIGIFPQPAACTTSGVLTFDLTAYKQTGLNETIQGESVVPTA
ncbi:unnamed protein product [Caenorhabditis auriculariae]|uniref:Structural maintenance of chromosomes protein 1 n=1 Tax=Caenorhabditis auriculariae TaxID=2777116 RepID=A0A8S1H6E7_9PELO|nr:unnamed protein product [Caenorhabditis auriculariae]